MFKNSMVSWQNSVNKQCNVIAYPQVLVQDAQKQTNKQKLVDFECLDSCQTEIKLLV